jgi:acyl-ACP thioesterase
MIGDFFMNGFSKQFEVDYISARPDMRTSFPRLMTYVQEGSTAHTESTAYPMAWFAENMTGWVITNWRVEVYGYPKYGDTIRVETWPSKFKGFLADRTFTIYDKDGNCVLNALSSWIYTDLNRRRPIRPFQEMIDGYGEPQPPKIEKDYVMPSLEVYDKINEYDFIVRRRDIDTNLHVNNIKYLEWAQDGIPDAIFQTASVAEMKTNYKKECACGDQVIVQTFQSKENGHEFVSLIKSPAEDGTENLLAEIYTKWV